MTKTTEPIGSLVYEQMELKKKAKDPHNTGKRKYPRASRRVGKCLSNNMQEYENEQTFTLAALRAGISALRAAIGLAFSPGTASVKKNKVSSKKNCQNKAGVKKSKA